MEANFPDAPVTKTEAGHFLQEEVDIEIANALLRIIDRIERNRYTHKAPQTLAERLRFIGPSAIVTEVLLAVAL